MTKAAMIDNQLRFSITELYKQDEGKMEEFHLAVEQEFDARDFMLKSPINTDVRFMKTEKAIAVMLENMTYDLEVNCTRCLKKIKMHIQIPNAERDFLFARPVEVEDERDVFLVDLKQMEVDLFEMFRQEILLHFPAFPVCSPSCKGICPVCGKDRNKADCGHDIVEKVDMSQPQKEVVHPFKDLKNIIKKDNS